MTRRPIRLLATWQLWLLTVSGSLLWLSGLIWLFLHYYGQTQSEFGPQSNPLEPWIMKLHGLVLIPALLGIGGLFVVHIPKGWVRRSQRLNAITLCVLLASLIVSGYLLYYVGDDAARSWTSIIHWSVGLVLPVVFVWHYLSGKRIRRRASR